MKAIKKIKEDNWLKIVSNNLITLKNKDLQSKLEKDLYYLLQEYYDYPEVIEKLRLDERSIILKNNEIRFTVIYNTHTHLACSGSNFIDKETKMKIILKEIESIFYLEGEEWFEKSDSF